MRIFAIVRRCSLLPWYRDIDSRLVLRVRSVGRSVVGADVRSVRRLEVHGEISHHLLRERVADLACGVDGVAEGRVGGHRETVGLVDPFGAERVVGSAGGEDVVGRGFEGGGGEGGALDGVGEEEGVDTDLKLRQHCT